MTLKKEKDLNTDRKLLLISLLGYFLICSVFPTFRLLFIGSKTSSGLFEYFISLIPEFLISILSVLTLFFYGKIKSDFKLLRYDWIIIIYIAFNVLYGSVISGNLLLSVYGIKMTYIPMVFYLIGRVVFFRAENQLDSFVKQIMYWLIGLAVIGLILYIFFPEETEKMIALSGWPVGKYFIRRMTSLFWTPVTFGTFMSVAAMYYCYKILFDGPQKKHYLFLSIVLSCLFLTVSRGSLIAFTIGFFVLAAFSQQWKKSMMLFGFVILEYIFVISLQVSIKLFGGWLFKSAMDTAQMEEGLSRVKLWQLSIQSFKEQPWGYGLGKAGHVAARFLRNVPSIKSSAYSTDGWYLKIANETGLAGLAFYLYITYTYFVSGLKTIRIKSYLNPLFVFIFIVFIMVNIQNIVSNVVDFYLFPCLYWLFIGISINLKAENKNA